MIFASCAMYPGYTHRQSLQAMADELSLGNFSEPAIGDLSVDHVQLVPQNKGQITAAVLEELQAILPNTRFRLHANAPVLPKHVFVDLNDYDREPEYFAALKAANQALGNPDYSAHSGRRNCSVRSLIEKTLRLQDFLGARVAIEGQYKTRRSGLLLVNCWKEYEQVLKSECYFALDLSHLNIVRSLEGAQDDLVLSMLQSERCIEVHLSSNDGSGDQHQVMTEPTWWHPMLGAINHCATVFSEGNRRINKVTTVKETEQ